MATVIEYSPVSAERDEAIAAVASLEQQQTAINQRYAAIISKATSEFEAAEHRLAVSREALRDAQTARNAEYNPRDGQRTRLLCRLDGELRPAVLVDALAEVERIFERSRAAANDEPVHVASVVAWCRESRQKLLALTSVPGDITTAVQAVLASQP